MGRENKQMPLNIKFVYMAKSCLSPTENQLQSISMTSDANPKVEHIRYVISIYVAAY